MEADMCLLHWDSCSPHKLSNDGAITPLLIIFPFHNKRRNPSYSCHAKNMLIIVAMPNIC